MKTFILALALSFAVSTAAFAQEVKPTHRINVRGTEYVVTDVRSHSHRWKYIGPKSLVLNTVVINKDGEQIAGYPVSVKVSELSKDDLKVIKQHDYRSFDERAPIKSFVVKQGPNIILTIFSLFRG